METWLFLHWTEIAGSIFAIVYLYFSIREKIWLWPTGFITSLFFLVVFFESRLYADMGLQVYYMGVSLYGWFHWAGKRQLLEPETKLPTTSLTLWQWLPYVLTTIMLNFLLYHLLISLPVLLSLPASDMPALDAFTTAASIVATWMLARKILENWVVWIVVDAVSMGIYFYKGLYITAFLFVVYTLMAILGYFQWKKHMKHTTNQEAKK